MVWPFKKKEEQHRCDWCGQAMGGDIIVTREGLFFCSTRCRNQQIGAPEPSRSELAMAEAESLSQAFFELLWQLYGTEVLEPYQAATQSLVTFSHSDRSSKLRDFAIRAYRKGVCKELAEVIQRDLDALQSRGSFSDAFMPRTHRVWIGWEHINDALTMLAGAMEMAPEASIRSTREPTFNEQADAMEAGRELRRCWSKLAHRYRRWSVS